jgi:hypothetical protein
MVFYAPHLGNQRQLSGADISAATGRKWPVAACNDAAKDRRQTALDPQKTLMTGRLLASGSTSYDAFGRGQHTQIP